MKKTVLIATALVLAISAFAQGNYSRQGFERPDEATMIKMRTDRMVQELGLDETQAAKLLELNQKYPFAMRGPGMRGPGGPGGQRMGGPQGEPGNDQKASDDNSGKKAKKAKKNKKANQSESTEAQPQARPEGGRPGRPQMTEEQMKEMQAAREAYENELKEILTEDQFKTYKENQNRRPQGRGPGGPGGFGPGGPGGFGPGSPGGFGNDWNN